MNVDIDTISGQVIMLSDTVRVNAYAEAIRRTVKKGDTVVDLGSGSGIMARFAALAGAAKVIAVEQVPDLCELNEVTNQFFGLDKVIEVVEASVEEVEIDEQVHVVISEMIGSLVDDERMSGVLTAFCAAHKSHLAADVKFVPEEVVLFGQMVRGSAGKNVPSTDEAVGIGPHLVRPGELAVLTSLDGLERIGDPFSLLSVSGKGKRKGGGGEVVAGSRQPRNKAVPRAMVCWFEARLAGSVKLDSRGDERVVTCWGWPLVLVSSEPADGNAPSDLELRFRVERFEDGSGLEVEARLA